MPQTITGTKEWSNRSLNFQAGCTNNCRYCYAHAMAKRFDQTVVWSEAAQNQKKVTKKFRKLNGVSMFPTTHDITPDNIDSVLIFLNSLLAPGNKVLIVSKPSLECIRRLCSDLKQYRDQILFRFTIGSTDNDVLRFWEPGAPSFDERLESLKYAHFAGYETSVSCEPMLDERVEDVIAVVSPYITNAIWIGKAKHLRARLKINGFRDSETMDRAHWLKSVQTDDKIMALFERLRCNSLIKWKDSIKNVVGLSPTDKAGLDI